MGELNNASFNSFEDCFNALIEAAQDRGFAVVSGGGTKKDVVLGWYKFKIICVKSKEYATQSKGKRNSSTGRSDCGWRGYVTYHKTSKLWCVTVSRDEHNHDPLDPVSVAITRRRLRTGEIIAEIGNMAAQ